MKLEEFIDVCDWDTMSLDDIAELAKKVTNDLSLVNMANNYLISKSVFESELDAMEAGKQ